MTAGVRGALELRAAAAEARRSSFPHLLRAHVAENRGERSNPTPAPHRHTVGDAGPHPDLATALEVNRADMQVLPHPPRCLDIGSSLDGDIIIDAKQIQRSGQESIVRALKVFAYFRAELPQNEGHQRRAPIHHSQGEERNVFQPSNAPDSQMHFAPLWVNARAHVVRVDVTPHEKLY